MRSIPIVLMLAQAPVPAGAQALGAVSPATLEAWTPPFLVRSAIESRSSSRDALLDPSMLRAPTAEPRPIGTALLGALGGTAVGVVAGAIIGSGVDKANGCGEDWCGLTGALAGASIGSTVLTPLGAHLANGRRGRFGPSLAAAVGGTVALWALAEGTDTGEMVLLIPLSHVITSVAVEVTTSP